VTRVLLTFILTSAGSALGLWLAGVQILHRLQGG
jgi:pheromone shutdown protein TraB